MQRLKEMYKWEIIDTYEYHLTNAQADLVRHFADCAKTAEQLALILELPLAKVKRLLAGDCDLSLPQLYKALLKVGVVPKLELVPLNQYVQDEMKKDDEHLKGEKRCH